MKWVALYIGLAACAVAASAIAEDAKPPMDPPAGDVTGTWSIIPQPASGLLTGVDNQGQSPSSCTFHQDGNVLTGTCKTVTVEGLITGTISGSKVEWRWLFNDGGVGDVHAYVVAVFKAELSSKDKIRGGFKNYPTLDKFNPSFEYNKKYEYVRATNFSATRQPAE